MESSVKELLKYRFECCREALEDAHIMFEAGRYKNALNSSYYSVFHAIRALVECIEAERREIKYAEHILWKYGRCNIQYKRIF